MRLTSALSAAGEIDEAIPLVGREHGAVVCEADRQRRSGHRKMIPTSHAGRGRRLGPVVRARYVILITALMVSTAALAACSSSSKSAAPTTTGVTTSIPPTTISTGSPVLTTVVTTGPPATSRAPTQTTIATTGEGIRVRALRRSGRRHDHRRPDGVPHRFGASPGSRRRTRARQRGPTTTTTSSTPPGTTSCSRSKPKLSSGWCKPAARSTPTPFRFPRRCSRTTGARAGTPSGSPSSGES